MRVEVVLYDPLYKEKASLENLCPKSIGVPEGFSLQGGVRKFITLANDDTLAIAIGPLLAGNSYYHKNILESFSEEDRLRQDLTEFQISGGGQIDFVLRWNNPVWFAKFSGESGDFGPFNKAVFDGSTARAITNAMKMNVSFETKLEQFARFQP